ncbi:MAG: hypothetical protein KatS3mg129_1715 [Leptospiraceae bacterium]|nr:MAG: hypothetical protein KatS3mg129_1715 [Leptospiraceae bacterium]
MDKENENLELYLELKEIAFEFLDDLHKKVYGDEAILTKDVWPTEYQLIENVLEEDDNSDFLWSFKLVEINNLSFF